MRSMTACALSGIQRRRHFIPDTGTNSHPSRRTSWTQCPPASSWMGKSGAKRIPSRCNSPPEHRFGRGTFQEAAKIPRKAEPSATDWSRFRYMVFDLPNRQATYEDRYNALGERSLPGCKRSKQLTRNPSTRIGEQPDPTRRIGTKDSVQRFGPRGRILPGYRGGWG